MRSGKVRKRILESDPLYKSRVVSRLINTTMERGKKSVAMNIVYGALNKISEDRKEAGNVLEQAVKNVMPRQEVRSRRVGGATYQIPYPLKHERAEALAVRWIVNSAKSKKGKPMADRLHQEIQNAYEDQGDAIKKRDDTHRMAEANRAFAHFRF